MGQSNVESFYIFFHFQSCHFWLLPVRSPVPPNGNKENKWAPRNWKNEESYSSKLKYKVPFRNLSYERKKIQILEFSPQRKVTLLNKLLHNPPLSEAIVMSFSTPVPINIRA